MTEGTGKSVKNKQTKQQQQSSSFLYSVATTTDEHDRNQLKNSFFNQIKLMSHFDCSASVNLAAAYEFGVEFAFFPSVRGQEEVEV